LKKKIGAITIGQSPRNDVIPEIKAVVGNNIEILEAGALDGLTKDKIDRFIIEKDDYILVSKLRDGSSVKFAERNILKRLQKCIYELEDNGAEIIVFICTGCFPDVFKSSKLLIYPQKILHSVVPKISNNKIGVFTPVKDQIKQCYEKWSESGKHIEVVSASPYSDIDKIREAAFSMKEKDVDIIVMDCIGYNRKMKVMVREITGKPVILPRTLVGRIVAEMFD
jgi:protein AroM